MSLIRRSGCEAVAEVTDLDTPFTTSDYSGCEGRTQAALDLVIAALETIRQQSDRAPRASRAALARLQAADPVAAPQREASASFTHLRSATARQAKRWLQSSQNKVELLTAIRERVRSCTKCEHLACS